MTDKTQGPSALPAQNDALMNAMQTMQNAGLGAMAGLSTAWMEAMSDLGAEVLSFIADRVKEDVRTQHQILHCKDFAEMQRIQGAFIQKAVEQYQVETGKLVEMSNDALSQAFSPIKIAN